MIYFTSDLHFNNFNKFEKRNGKETDNLIVSNWNNKVTNADTVYILGDLGIPKNKESLEYICQTISILKGKKVLIRGNHDNDLLKDIRIKQLFVEICDYKEITINKTDKSYKLVLSHYPILIWNGQHKNYIHLYGHVHNTKEYDIYKNCLNELNKYFYDMEELEQNNNYPQVKAYNVGCMMWNYEPVSLSEILEGGTINDKLGILNTKRKY